MSKKLHYFESNSRCSAVALPFELDKVIDEWASLRAAMTRHFNDSFSRDEWAYLITFLERENLMQPFKYSFGIPVENISGKVSQVIRPRGTIAVWLPNNVSLLGPLIFILLSLTGNSIMLKGGSQSKDLTGAFLDFCNNYLPNGVLKHFINNRVTHDIFDREDIRNEKMASQANIRIVFGSDNTARYIHTYDHPVESTGFSFIDRRSEAWIEKSEVNESVLITLLKVFAVYGQVGCTSPRRVVLLEGTLDDAIFFRDRLVKLWPKINTRDPEIYIASSNIMAAQLSSILGWEPALAQRNSAVIASGERVTPIINTPMFLPIVASTLDHAISDLPENIQTIGWALSNPQDSKWLKIISKTSVKRFVPISRMHYFGSEWDGQSYWEQTFEKVEVVQ